jgi:hypothetical protein
MRTWSCFIVTLLVAVVGCRQARDVERPPEDTIYLAAPSEDIAAGSDNEARQAACASDSVVYDDVKALIDQYNETISDRIDALRLVLRAAGRQLEREGELEFTAEGARGSLTLVAVQSEEDGSVQFGASFTPTDGDAVPFLSGAMDGSRESGTWTLLRVNGDVAVEASWTRDLEQDNLAVTRTVNGAFGERTSFYARDAQAATIDFTGPQHEASLTWDRETKDGELTVTDIGREGVTGTFCWDADLDAQDFCTVPCE